MNIKMNNELINESVDDVVSTVNFLCKNDLSYLELTSKLDALNDKFYTVRVDIGDGYADNLKEHIYKSVKEIHRNSNISTNHMKALLNVLNIKLGNNIKNNIKNKDISLKI